MFNLEELEKVNNGLEKVKLLSNGTVSIMPKTSGLGRTIADVYRKGERIYMRPGYLDFEDFLVMDELAKIMSRLLSEL